MSGAPGKFEGKTEYVRFLDQIRYGDGTWLESEGAAYPRGGQTRRGVAVWPDGKKRRVYAGIPDTFFSIPAHGRLSKHGKKVYIGGFLTVADDGTLQFHAMERYDDYFKGA